MAGVIGPWSLRNLRERCQYMRDALLARDAVTEAELDVYVPGGEENAGRDYGAWIIYYGHLTGFHYRETERDGRDGEKKDARAAALALAALSRQPIEVPLHWVPDGAPTPCLVHPKGVVALMELDLLDWMLNYYVAAQAVAEKHQAADLLAESARLAALVHGLIIWGTTHPGHMLPWSPFTRPPAPPDWTLHIDPVDALGLVVVKREVNGGRTRCLEVLTRPGDGRRMSWASAIAASADRARTEAFRMLESTTFESMVIQKGLADEVSRQAYEDAQARRSGP